MQRRLTDAIMDWPTPTSTREVQQFVGLTNYYRRFIKDYANIVQPITDLIRTKNLPFTWGPSQQLAMERLKEALTSAPTLAHPSSKKMFTVSTDASMYAVGATLEQDGHPVAYLSNRLSETESRWDTGDQELLAFMIALREWDVYLRGRPFLFKTDHEPIRYLQTKTRLNGRQARWLDTLQSYSYDTVHVPGVKHIVPDALSRRPDHVPRLQNMTVMPPSFITDLKEAYRKEKFSKQLLHYFENGTKPTDAKANSQISNFSYNGNCLFWETTGNRRLYIPAVNSLRDNLVLAFHLPSHFHTDKTYARLVKHAYWPGMYSDTDGVCASCHDCQINKIPNTRLAGKLQPHDSPSACWDVISMDFVTELPTSSSGFDAVFVIVDKLSKRALFIPTNKTVDTAEAAQLLQSHVFSKHGVPTRIISDRDPRFKSNFWKGMSELLSVKLNISSTDHPQTDGQSEITIRTLSNMLRKSIQTAPESWHELLPVLEFEYNCAKHSSTGLSPFEVDIGRIPSSPVSRQLASCNVQSQPAFDLLERIANYRSVARDNIARLQAKQKYYADRKRTDVKYQVDDLVLLRSDAVHAFNKSNLPKKWRPKFLGPLRILEVMGPVTYKLELPPSMQRTHDVIHVSKLKKYLKPRVQSGSLPIVVDADGTEEMEVAEILEKKGYRRALYYLVRFEDEPRSEAVWLSKSELKNCKDLIKDFEKATGTSQSNKGVSVTK